MRTYLHILTKKDSSKEDNAQPWEGITGRVKFLIKRETNRMLKEVRLDIGKTSEHLDQKIDVVDQKIDKLTVLMEQLVARNS